MWAPLLALYRPVSDSGSEREGKDWISPGSSFHTTERKLPLMVINVNRWIIQQKLDLSSCIVKDISFLTTVYSKTGILHSTIIHVHVYPIIPFYFFLCRNQVKFSTHNFFSIILCNYILLINSIWKIYGV